MSLKITRDLLLVLPINEYGPRFNFESGHAGFVVTRVSDDKEGKVF